MVAITHARIAVQQALIGWLSVIFMLHIISQLFWLYLVVFNALQTSDWRRFDISHQPIVNYQTSRKHWLFGNVMWGIASDSVFADGI